LIDFYAATLPTTTHSHRVQYFCKTTPLVENQQAALAAFLVPQAKAPVPKICVKFGDKSTGLI
jgi:hypothetical protein